MKTVSVQDVRCPRCLKKLGENLDGAITLWCNNCKARVMLDTRPRIVVEK